MPWSALVPVGSMVHPPGARVAALCLTACAAVGPSVACDPDQDVTATPSLSPGEGLPFAVEVTRFAPGEGAGFGQDVLPDVVLGPPVGGGHLMGSTDVLSLGVGGVIELRLGVRVVDGEGVDLLVFENAFYYGEAPEAVFAEPGEIAVSDDGQSWVSLACAPEAYPWAGCAGKTPVYSSAESGIAPDDAPAAGGDGLDLAELGLSGVRFVRITDKGTSGAAPSAGFDLDAVAAVNWE